MPPCGIDRKAALFVNMKTTGYARGQPVEKVCLLVDFFM